MVLAIFAFQSASKFLFERLMSKKIAYLGLTILAVFFTACSTDYYTYSGSAVYEGKGGASKNINGVDIWLVGTPPRKFKIIGYITDTRPGGPIPMARRDGDLAAEAKKNGGDAILIKADERDFLGTYSTANATAVSNGNVTTGFGSGVSVPIIRREGQFFVIKYVD